MQIRAIFLTLAALVPAAPAAAAPVGGSPPLATWPRLELDPYSRSYPLLQAIGAYADSGPAAALPFLLDSAGSGNPMAMRLLGLMYARGEGVPADGQQAIKWFRTAAERGDGESMYVLGIAYANGTWVDQDRGVAAHWLQRAAAQRVPNASKRLQSLQLQGR